MKQSTDVQSIHKVLDYAKSKNNEHQEKVSLTGYSTQSIQEKEPHSQCDLIKCLVEVGYDFSNKIVLDIGCSVDSLLHDLTDKITSGVGIDSNDKWVNKANALKAKNLTDNIQFYTFDLDNGNLSILRDFLFTAAIDICLFFNFPCQHSFIEHTFGRMSFCLARCQLLKVAFPLKQS